MSNQRATREDLKELHDKYTEVLQTRRARKDGVDRIRTQTACQVFDEVIRETAVEAKEMALLLLRLRYFHVFGVKCGIGPVRSQCEP